jgi:hypothetical protein
MRDGTDISGPSETAPVIAFNDGINDQAKEAKEDETDDQGHNDRGSVLTILLIGVESINISSILD